MRLPAVRWILVAFAAVVLATITAALYSRARQSRIGTAVLSKSSEMSPMACYAATTETRTVFCTRTVTSTARVLRCGRDMWRVEYLSAPATGILLGSNGEVQWRLVPGKDVTIVSASTADNPMHLLRNYRARQAGYEKVAGRRAHVINLFDARRRLARRLFLDRERFVILRTQAFDRRGNLVAETTVRQIEFMPELPTDAFDVPLDSWPPIQQALSPRQCAASLAALEKAAGFAVAMPRSLPDSYRLKYTCLLHGAPACGCRVVHLNYSDGVRSLSIFETSRGHHASCPFNLRQTGSAAVVSNPVHYGPGTAFADLEGSPIIVAFGDLPAGQLEKVVRSAR